MSYTYQFHVVDFNASHQSGLGEVTTSLVNGVSGRYPSNLLEVHVRADNPQDAESWVRLVLKVRGATWSRIVFVCIVHSDVQPPHLLTAGDSGQLMRLESNGNKEVVVHTPPVAKLMAPVPVEPVKHPRCSIQLWDMHELGSIRSTLTRLGNTDPHKLWKAWSGL